jgi:ankyrin repeat protein
MGVRAALVQWLVRRCEAHGSPLAHAVALVERPPRSDALVSEDRQRQRRQQQRDDALAESVLAGLRARCGATARCDAQLALCHACALGYERAAGYLVELLEVGDAAGGAMDAAGALPRLEVAYRALLLLVGGKLRGARAARRQGPVCARIVARLLDWEPACVDADTVRAMLLLPPGDERARGLRAALAASDAGGDTPLSWMCMMREDDDVVDIVRALLAAGAGHTPRQALDAELMTPLHWAAYLGNARVAALLLGAGAAADARCADGFTPLMLLLHHRGACREGTVGVARALLAAGADPDPDPAGGEAGPLHHAAPASAAVTDLLLAAGADPNRRDSGGNTPLHCAGSAATVRRLVAAGARVDAPNADRETPLHAAVRFCGVWGGSSSRSSSSSLEVIDALVLAGADPRACDLGILLKAVDESDDEREHEHMRIAVLRRIARSQHLAAPPEPPAHAHAAGRTPADAARDAGLHELAQELRKQPWATLWPNPA